jgi:hypothetical protein
VTRSYPADPADAALALFTQWLGAHYARSIAVESVAAEGSVARAAVLVGRKWRLEVTLLDTLSPGTTVPWEAARAALEQRLDAAGLPVALWVPRGAAFPSEEPGLSAIAAAVEDARPVEDGRFEAVRPVRLYLRRTSTTGSVITILGGLAPHWAQFTNRVPGSYQLNSLELFRLPASEEARTQLADRIVLAAGQPEADDSQEIPAEDCWTVNRLEGDRAFVLGSPHTDSDEQSASLRRTLRKLVREANALPGGEPAPQRALVILGAATYAEEEKISWALRGMDPAQYAAYGTIAVVADGLVRPILEPARGSLPWDAPLPGATA